MFSRHRGNSISLSNLISFSSQLLQTTLSMTVHISTDLVLWTGSIIELWYPPPNLQKCARVINLCIHFFCIVIEIVGGGVVINEATLSNYRDKQDFNLFICTFLELVVVFTKNSITLKSWIFKYVFYLSCQTQRKFNMFEELNFFEKSVTPDNTLNEIAYLNIWFPLIIHKFSVSLNLSSLFY